MKFYGPYQFMIRCGMSTIIYDSWKELCVDNEDKILEKYFVIFSNIRNRNIKPTLVTYICPDCNQLSYAILNIEYDENREPILDKYETSDDVIGCSLHVMDLFPFNHISDDLDSAFDSVFINDLNANFTIDDLYEDIKKTHGYEFETKELDLTHLPSFNALYNSES